ncbi:MAG: FHA domain-containing protein [Chloroflexi bacterium]|nr:FHA domain-containing protein [Chloroflexota bacterium]
MKTNYGTLSIILPDGTRREITLIKPQATLGRDNDSDIVLDDGRVSRVHAMFEIDDEGPSIVDLDSRNGTALNGRPVEQETAVNPNDVITVGDTQIRFNLEPLPKAQSDFPFIDDERDLTTTIEDTAVLQTVFATDAPRIVIHTPEKTWEVVVQDGMVIGRDPRSDVLINQGKVSRQHAVIEERGGVYFIRDLNSRNGTWADGRRIDGAHHLSFGETLRIGDAHITFKNAFNNTDLHYDEPLYRSDGTPSRMPVVVIPGFMGSELWSDTTRQWPNVWRAFIDPEIYRLDAGRPVMSLEPRAVVDEVVIVPNLLQVAQYSRLGDFLEEDLGYTRGVDLLEFPHDWRLDNREIAAHLAQALDEWDAPPPYAILAHSMGTLSTRYFIERLGGKDIVGRFISIGGPNYGLGKSIPSLLTGRGVLPFGNLGDRFRELLATFPPMYQSLPLYPKVYDQTGAELNLFSQDTWLEDWQRPFLRDALKFHRELGQTSSVPTVSVFGYNLRTIARVNVVVDRDGRFTNMDLVYDDNGDNSVIKRSAIIQGSEIHPVEQHHGSLYVDKDVQMRLMIELTKAVPV